MSVLDKHQKQMQARSHKLSDPLKVEKIPTRSHSQLFNDSSVVRGFKLQLTTSVSLYMSTTVSFHTCSASQPTLATT